jgi:hypothetical protein
MKIKKRYILLLAASIVFPFYYHQYGWIWNPWAAPRLVWDEPNPELIGKTFSITVPATYTIDSEAGDGPIGKQGVTRVITLDSGQPSNKPSGQYYRIQTADEFTIQKTYWLRINSWDKGFYTDKKFAIVSDIKNQSYIFNFLDFYDTNRPEYVHFKKLYDNQSPWEFKKQEIAYK